MEKYKLRFFFEYFGPCFWSANDRAREKYGYPIETEVLPLSIDLKSELNKLGDEYVTCINWDSPADPSPWTKEQEACFMARTNAAYERVKNELGSEYEVINEAVKTIANHD